MTAMPGRAPFRAIVARHLLSDAPVWALADQCLVSGVNFAANVLLARNLGLSGYGTFVTLYSVTLFAWSCQLALFMMPTMSIAPKLPDAARGRYLRGANALQLAFSLLVGSIAIVAGLMGVMRGWLDYQIAGAWVSATVAYLVQDGLRRYYFVSRRSRTAFTNDLITYGGQLALLIGLLLVGRLTIAAAFLAMTAASGAAVISGFLLESLLIPLRDAWRAYGADSWRMGRDLWITVQLQWANNNGLLLLGTWFIGPQAAGAVRAVQALVGPLNVILQAMDNVVPARAARHHAADPVAGLDRYIGRLAWQGGAVFGAGSLLIAALASTFVTVAYGRTLVDSLHGLIPWALAYICLAFFIRLALYRYRTLGITQNIVNIAGAAILTSVVTFVLLIYSLHELAIVVSMVTGQCIALIYAYCWSRGWEALPRASRLEGTAP